MTDSILVTMSVLTPVIIALVQVTKGFAINEKWMPVIAILFGLIGACIMLGNVMGTTIWVGLLSGLSASGLYSGVKKTVG